MRATAGTVAILAVALCLLSGCSAPAERETPPPAASAASPSPAPPVAVSPSPRPTAVVDVPRVDAGIAANQVPVAVPPVRVRVDSLGIDMPVEAVGLAADGAMELPPNTAVAAWYRHGPWPASEAGATVIAAHVDSLTYGVGPFAGLADAPVGTEIVVATADGGERRYVVETVRLTDKPDVPWDQVFDRGGPARLTLVTCGGAFDYEARRYLSNVIVTARPLQ